MTIGLSKPRTLLFSQRNIFEKYLFRCPHLEFENIISEVDSVEVVAPRADCNSRRSNLVGRMAYHFPISLNPGIQAIKPNDHYDLFVAICGYPADLLMVDASINWRDHCTKSVCLIDELWVREIPGYKHFFRILQKFDVVVLYYSQSVEPLSEHIGSKCMFLPPGVDALLFSPFPQCPQRSIDVYSIGRRSERTHQALIEMSAESGLFYLHDSVAGNKAVDSNQHRTLFANIAKRSRYFVVNPGLIDRPDKTNNQSEIGNRYFEGAASGTVMIGERPRTHAFEEYFDWPDAVVHLEYGSSAVDRVISELDRDLQRQERIRRTNVVQSLLRHDWIYRWEAILRAVDLEPMPGFLQRKERLKSLARQIPMQGSEHLQFAKTN
jgi:hypothetical protein